LQQLRISYQITNRDTISLDKYLYDIGKVNLLSADDEVELANRIKTGDEQALNTLTKANLRFVVSVAKQYQNQGLPLTDLINEGNIGLIKAAQKFDASRGFKFISYAVWWIRQSIMQALIDKARLVRLPLSKATAYKQLYRASIDFEQKNERKPNLKELEEMTDIKSDTITIIMNNSTRHMSTDAPVSEGEDMVFADLLQDESADKPDVKLHYASLKKDLGDIMECLSTRERNIITSYFGLDGETRLSLSEIGDKFDLTRERVRQIKERALRRLRKVSKSKVLLSYLD
jgi:RNA polymerase primary sigma factor